jgi:hypothetical protein
MKEPAATRPGRNELCRCGSGRKYKQCCLQQDEAEASAARAKAAAAAAAVEPVPETAAATPARPPKPQTQQPWKASATRAFSKRSRMPRKVGGG